MWREVTRHPAATTTGGSSLVVVHKGDLAPSMVLESTARVLIPRNVIYLIGAIVVPVQKAVNLIF